MPIDTSIQTSLDRMVSAFEARPATAFDTTKTRAVLQDGFKTVTREGDSELIVDMPAAVGGTGAGPTPGVFGRACITSCIAIAIRIAAERRGVNVDEVAIDLSIDWDGRGMFGLDGVTAGP